MGSSRFWITIGTLIAVIAMALALSSAGAPRRAMASTTLSTASPTLSPAQMAGQRVVYSYHGLRPPPRLLWLISHGQAAGVIFFGDNITGHAQIGKVVQQLEDADASPLNPVRAPLLLMTDQEGGQVRRLTGAPRLSEKQIGESADPVAAATSAGTGAAHNLAGVGINLNLAPVLDVYRAAGDFDDHYGRSYSTDPALVSELGADFIAAQQKAAVAATAKHFPGLGAATRSQNTDLRAVTLNVARSTLRTVDELPFQAAIARGVRLIMVSWAVYPALDATHPAGLSPAVVENELRGRLGFHGVTLTDAIEASALHPFGTVAHRSILAARAGMDLILCSKGQLAEGEYAAATLKNGYLDGTLDKAAFAASVRRVIALRSSLGG